jgi:large subunit ribosomal protein L32e
MCFDIIGAFYILDFILGKTRNVFILRVLFVYFIFMVINKELVEARKKVADKRPRFVRQESWRYDRLAENWRKPKGKDNKMRRQVSGVPQIVKVGYRGPKHARGLHPSGYTDNIIFNVNDLNKLDPKKDAARLAHTVGARKRKEIISKATSMQIKILNPGKASPKKDKEELGEND